MIHLIGLAIYAGSVSLMGAYKAHKEKTRHLPAPVESCIKGDSGDSDQETSVDTVEKSRSHSAAATDIQPASIASQMESDANLTNHYLKYAGLSFGIALVGRIFYPPLGLLSLIPLAYSAQPVNEQAIRSIRERRVNISILDSISVVIGVAVGLFVMSAMASIFYLVAMKMLYQTRNHARNRLTSIFGSHAQDVWVLVDGVEVSMPLLNVNKGDLLVLNAGEMVPVDGEVVEGMAMVDQHQLTGEAQPDEKIVGQKVFAATLLIAGRIVVRVEKTGQDTVATQITMALEGTDDYITTLQTRGEKVADSSVLPTMGIAGATALLVGGTAGATVISSNFSEIMRIAVPLTMMNYLHLASGAGLLIKDGRSLEQLIKVDTVVFDKTGTLTQEQPHVGSILPEDGLTENELLLLIASAEYRQSHPIARAVLAEAEKRGIELQSIEGAEYQIGFGLTVHYQGNEIKVGSRRFMQNESIVLPDDLAAVAQQSSTSGNSILYCCRNGRYAGALELKPTIRPEAERVIRQLHERGLKVIILSGDHAEPVARLAQELGVDQFYAERLPEEKARLVEQMQEEGRVVCFVGDGINDSIALKRAAVSVSLQDGSHIARDSAQIVLLEQNLEQLVMALDMAQRFARQRDVAINYGVVLPSAISMTGGIFLGFTVVNAMLFYCISAISGFGIAMIPLLFDEYSEGKGGTRRETLLLPSPKSID
ncbi:MAG: heavy metal translocating P-type ATPase [Clostridia bacterium]